MNNEINWKINNDKNERTTMRLSDAVIDVPHSVCFVAVFQTDKGAIGAEVSCETLPGELLWLSGDFGASNGLNSLTKAAGGDPGAIVENTFTYTRVSSDNSPSGYAHYWQA